VFQFFFDVVHPETTPIKAKPLPRRFHSWVCSFAATYTGAKFDAIRFLKEKPEYSGKCVLVQCPLTERCATLLVAKYTSPKTNGWNTKIGRW